MSAPAQCALGAWRLVIHMALLMPSEAAIGAASIEWRCARAAWLDALAEMGLDEARVRSLAAEMNREAWAAAMLKIEPRGRA